MVMSYRYMTDYRWVASYRCVPSYRWVASYRYVTRFDHLSGGHRKWILVTGADYRLAI